MLGLTEQLQQLTDRQLAQDIQRQLIIEASQQARDHRLAATLSNREDDGPDGVEAVGRSLSNLSIEEGVQVKLTFVAEMKAEPGPAGCAAVLTSAAGAKAAAAFVGALHIVAVPSCYWAICRQAYLGSCPSDWLQAMHCGAAALC